MLDCVSAELRVIIEHCTMRMYGNVLLKSGPVTLGGDDPVFFFLQALVRKL
jgi:hypothetical protein